MSDENTATLEKAREILYRLNNAAEMLWPTNECEKMLYKCLDIKAIRALLDTVKIVEIQNARIKELEKLLLEFYLLNAYGVFSLPDKNYNLITATASVLFFS